MWTRAIVHTVARIFRDGPAGVQDPYPLFARVCEEAPLLRALALGPDRAVALRRRVRWRNNVALHGPSALHVSFG